MSLFTDLFLADGFSGFKVTLSRKIKVFSKSFHLLFFVSIFDLVSLITGKIILF